MPRTARAARTPRRRATGSGLIALLTDFGTRDPYVGTMKGVILGIHPQARIVDLTHDVAPQDVLGAYFLLRNTYRYFPAGTVFVAVVDPGVGTHRRIVCVETSEQVFLAPDNGILHFLVQSGEARRIVEVTNEKLFLHPVSNTFHGRDIFAPVAAHIAKGMDIARAGRKIAALAALDEIPDRVVRVDRFGNLITNIPAARLEGAREVVVAGKFVARVAKTYADGAPGELLALPGSHGQIEIAVPNGSAAEVVGAAAGARVEVRV
jgi:S-adenosylmethionine hydrolase